MFMHSLNNYVFTKWYQELNTDKIQQAYLNRSLIVIIRGVQLKDITTLANPALLFCTSHSFTQHKRSPITNNDKDHVSRRRCDGGIVLALKWRQNNQASFSPSDIFKQNTWYNYHRTSLKVLWLVLAGVASTNHSRYEGDLPRENSTI